MRYSYKDMQKLSDTLGKRFKGLRLYSLDARIGGWEVVRRGTNGSIENISGVLRSNAETVAYLDGLNKGADLAPEMRDCLLACKNYLVRLSPTDNSDIRNLERLLTRIESLTSQGGAYAFVKDA